MIEENIKSGQRADHDNVIVFVHGRGRHPEKALTQIIPKLETENTADVLMFHWSPSYAGPFGYPDEHAIAASARFGEALKKFNEYKRNLGQAKDLKNVLLVHSMGNIVLETYMKDYHVPGSLDRDLFDTIVLNSADVDAKGHAAWVRAIDFTDNLYITVNENDKVLKFAGIKNFDKRLGKKIKADVPLSDNVKYVQFDNTGANHRYYLHAGQNGNCHIRRFYKKVLGGDPIDLDQDEGVEKVDRGRVYVFKFDKRCPSKSDEA